MCNDQGSIEDLNEEELRALYFAYIEYRDALSYLDTPVSVMEFFKANKEEVLNNV